MDKIGIKYGGLLTLVIVMLAILILPTRVSALTPGTAMQQVTADNCPTERTRVQDARDGRSYWIRRIPNTRQGGGDLCWMEANLAYAGDGSTTYGDTTTLIVANGLGSSFTDKQVITNLTDMGGLPPTDEPNDPSTVSGAGGQYGYLYNWCAAMGGQGQGTGNVAGNVCINGSNATSGFQVGVNTGAGDNNTNICPSTSKYK